MVEANLSNSCPEPSKHSPKLEGLDCFSGTRYPLVFRADKFIEKALYSDVIMDNFRRKGGRR